MIAPLRRAWVERLCETILAIEGPVVLAAHSLGCIATVHLPEAVAARIQVALADPERRGVLADFAPVPYQALPYRSIVVASSNDPFCPVGLALLQSLARTGNVLGEFVRAGSPVWLVGRMMPCPSCLDGVIGITPNGHLRAPGTPATCLDMGGVQRGTVPVDVALASACARQRLQQPQAGQVGPTRPNVPSGARVRQRQRTPLPVNWAAPAW